MRRLRPTFRISQFNGRYFMSIPKKNLLFNRVVFVLLIMMRVSFFVIFPISFSCIVAQAQEGEGVQVGSEDKGKIVNRQGTEMGSIDENGNVLNISGILMGSADSEGRILNGNGIDVGKVTKEGNVMNQSETIIGSVNANGEIFNVSGYKMGEVKGENDLKRIGAAARLIILK
jgi:hypothetical protein